MGQRRTAFRSAAPRSPRSRPGLALPNATTKITSTADLKSLRHKRRTPFRDFRSMSGTRINKFASAHDFPKFVKVGAAMEHELRKVGTSQLTCLNDVNRMRRESGPPCKWSDSNILHPAEIFCEC